MKTPEQKREANLEDQKKCRRKTWKMTEDLMMRVLAWLGHLRDELTVHLEQVDDENVSDNDLATTQRFNQRIGEYESDLLRLKAGEKGRRHARRLWRLKPSQRPSWWYPPPKPRLATRKEIEEMIDAAVAKHVVAACDEALALAKLALEYGAPTEAVSGALLRDADGATLTTFGRAWDKHEQKDRRLQ